MTEISSEALRCLTIIAGGGGRKKKVIYIWIRISVGGLQRYPVCNLQDEQFVVGFLEWVQPLTSPDAPESCSAGINRPSASKWTLFLNYYYHYYFGPGPLSTQPGPRGKPLSALLVGRSRKWAVSWKHFSVTRFRFDGFLWIYSNREKGICSWQASLVCVCVCKWVCGEGHQMAVSALEAIQVIERRYRADTSHQLRVLKTATNTFSSEISPK